MDGTVSIFVDGERVGARVGQSVAAALLSAGIVELRRSPSANQPRGAFCLMGLCQECAILIDGSLQQACLVPVRDGMQIARRGSL